MAAAVNTDPRTVELIVGLDFGTSSTKVVVRAPFEAGAVAWAVPFEDLSHETSVHFLPSTVGLGRDGVFRLERVQGGPRLFDIKATLVHSPASAVQSTEPEGRPIGADVAAAAFCALVLRYAKSWFEANKRAAVFGDVRLHWNANLGMPSKNVEGAARSDYLRVAHAAWALAANTAPVSVANVERALAGPPQRSGSAIGLFPEVFAEVASYARSDERDEGLHLIVDVGAGTLDVCGFVLHEMEGSDRYSQLVADVKPLGSLNLHRTRRQAMKRAFDASYRETADFEDPIAPVPDAENYVLQPAQVARRAIEDADTGFARNCRVAIGEAIRALKILRDPYSERWQTALPVFLCGGGSRCGLYQGVMSQINGAVRALTGNLGADMLELPRPTNFEMALPETEYHRLAVAGGLSWPDSLLGEVVPVGDIKDILRDAPHNYEAAFIDKSMV